MKYDGRTCKYRLFVNCELQMGCNKCGWNPDVESERKSKLKKSHKTSNKWLCGKKHK